MSARVLVLGGYGNTGQRVARLLLEHTQASVIVAGRDARKADATAVALDPQRCSAVVLDAADPAAVRSALDGVDLLIVAASVGEHLRGVMGAALAGRVPGMDTLLPSPSKHSMLSELRPAFAASGLTWVTDCGFHPGLPALLVRHASAQLGSVTSAHIGSVIAIDWRPLEFSDATRSELVEELLNFSSLALVDGRWQDQGWTTRHFEFGGVFGGRDGYAMHLPELQEVAATLPSLTHLGFYVGGFNPLTDYAGLPLAWMLAKLGPRRCAALASRLLLGSLRLGSRPPFGTVLRLEAQGQREGQTLTLTTQLGPTDGYELTAAPVVACAQQLLDGSVELPGIHCQALLAEPARLIADLQKMGIAVTSNLAANSSVSPG